jgi:hypothetical protein
MTGYPAMSVSPLVDPDTLRRALDLVGEDLRGKRILGEIMICSGSAFLLRYGWRDDGTKIEIDISLDGKNGPIRQACDWAGNNLKLVEGWPERLLPRLIGDGIAREGGFPSGMYPSWEKPGLRVVSAPPQLMIPMVFLATLRPMDGMTVQDMEPAIQIAAHHGIRTGKRLRRMITPYLESRPASYSDLEREVDRKVWQFEEAIGFFGLGPLLEREPRSLRDVADAIRGHPDWYGCAMYTFMEAFFVEESRAARQVMLDPTPVPTGDWKNDTWIGAIGEHVAQRWNLLIPAWTQEEAFMGGKMPYFSTELGTARDIEIVETPPAFRRRLIFGGAEPLMNAKFPNAMKVTMPYWN